MQKHLGLSGTKLMVILTASQMLTTAWFGYDQGVFSGVLISDDFLNHFPRVKADANVSGITSSCFSLGAFCGAIFAFTFGEKVGRKRTIIVGSFLNIIGAILQVASFWLPMLIIGRIINGFGMGMTSSTCPLYQAECTTAKYRGRLVVAGSVANTAAYCLSNWMNFGLFFSSGPFQWRFPLAFQLIFPIFSVPMMFILPESPRWLLNHGKEHEGLNVISVLRGKDLSKHGEEINREYYNILGAIEEERAEDVPLKQVLFGKDKNRNFRRLLLSMGTQFMQQWTGINFLGYYLPTILKTQLGFSTEMAKLLSGVNATSYLCAALICLVIIDKVGRRILMLYGATGCFIAYLIAAIALKVGETHSSNQMASLTVAMFFIYYFIYGTSYAKVPWVYSAEINSIGWRTRGAAAATATNWIMGFCITQFTPIAIKNLGWGVYLLFSLIILSYVPIVWFFYPETSNRTLEDINYVFIEYDTIFLGKHKELRQRERPENLIEAELARINALSITKDDDDKFDSVHLEVSSTSDNV